MKHIIKPNERGHRKPLSNEKTVSYTIRLPESLKAKCILLGAMWVRMVLKKEGK